MPQGQEMVGQEMVAFARLSEAVIGAHGPAGNAAMTRRIVGSLHVLPQQAAFAGREETRLPLSKGKVPSFAFADRDVQRACFEEATGIIHEMSRGRHPKDRVFIDVVHAVDGAWTAEGRPRTNAEIGKAIAQGRCVARAPLRRSGGHFGRSLQSQRHEGNAATSSDYPARMRFIAPSGRGRQ